MTGQRSVAHDCLVFPPATVVRPHGYVTTCSGCGARFQGLTHEQHFMLEDAHRVCLAGGDWQQEYVHLRRDTDPLTDFSVL